MVSGGALSWGTSAAWLHAACLGVCLIHMKPSATATVLHFYGS